jgi:hypothetical protein
MSKHNDIYNILGKLNSLKPQEETKPSILKEFAEPKPADVVQNLNAKYQEHKQLNEYFHFDMPKGKDRGPRDTGTDELARRSKLGKNPLVKHGKEYKEKDRHGDAYKIGGPKGPLPEGDMETNTDSKAKYNEPHTWPKGARPGKYNTDTKQVSHWDRRTDSEREQSWNTMIEDDMEEGPADLLAAIEQEINNPGGSVDNLRDVLNATFGSDRSPEFKKARAVIGKYLDLVDNAAMGSEQDGIAPMGSGNIARHIQQYDLTDYLQHAAAMLDKVVQGPIDESGLQAYLGKKKYGEQGMKALQKAGRDGASKEKMALLRAKHDKLDEISQELAGNYMTAAEKDIKARKQKDTFDPKIGKRKEGKFHAVLRKTGTVPTTDNPTHGKFLQREGEMDEDMLSAKQKKFAALAEPKDKITYADKIAGAKKKDEGNEFSGELVKARAQGKDSFSVDGKEYPVKEGFEDQHDVTNKGEYDQEGDMAKDDLSTIEDAARELDSILSADDNLPEWVQSKINKAMDYLDTARDYMKANTDDDNPEIKEDDEYQGAGPEQPRGKTMPYRQFEIGVLNGFGDIGVWFNGKYTGQGFNKGPKAIEYAKAFIDQLHAKADEQDMTEGEYKDSVNKSKVPAFQRKAKGGDWKVSTKDLEDEASKSPTGRAGLEKLKQRMRDDGVMEGFPTVADAKARAEKEKGTGKFDKQTTSTGTRYTRKPETYSDDGEESGTSDAPKKRGRPKKHTGPERVTSKAWKHKGGRKTNESIKLDTFVEDTIGELDALLLSEKAVSKQQQKFMGMVHAMQKGEKVKGASKELKAAAKGMSKKDARDFAKTKHKGLPSKVTEGINFVEMMRETDQTVEEMLNELHAELDEYKRSGQMGDKLRDALELHRHSKNKLMGETKEKERDDFFYNPDVPDDQQLPALPDEVKVDVELDELAKLAGLGEVSRGEYIKQQDAQAERAGKDSFNAFGQNFDTDQVQEASCNMTAEGQFCPEHGLAECGSMMYEGKEVPLEECGDMSPMGNMPQPESGMSVNTSFDTKTGRKTMSVTADGEAAEQLAQMLKMAGLGHDHSHDHGPERKIVMVPEEEVTEEFANEPNEQYADTQTIVDAGQDLNRKKKQYADKPKAGDNPMATENVQLEDRLAALYDSIKVKSE